jgi:hypothetical protein
MASVDRTVKGQSLEDYLAGLPGVGRYMRDITFELQAYAEVNLEEARSQSLFIGRQFDDNARVESQQTNRRKNQWAVVLDDTDRVGDNRQGAANNIEQGRLDYFRRDTGMPYGGMEGLNILTLALQTLRDRHRGSLRG